MPMGVSFRGVGGPRPLPGQAPHELNLKPAQARPATIEAPPAQANLESKVQEVQVYHPGYGLNASELQKKRKRELARNVKRRKKLRRTMNIKPTVDDIIEDKITEIASKFWASSSTNLEKYDKTIISKLYKTELAVFYKSRVTVLEFSCYLENFLWKHYNPKDADFEHVMSIILLVNEKEREQVPMWDCFRDRPRDFKQFLKSVFQLKTDPYAFKHGFAKEGSKQKWRSMNILESEAYVVFLINMLQSFENQWVQELFIRMVHIQIWEHIHPARRNYHVASVPYLKRQWERYTQILEKQKREARPKTLTQLFLPAIIHEFFDVLVETNPERKDSQAVRRENNRIRYLNRFLELLIDLLTQLSTRRFLCLYLVETHFAVKCRLSKLGKWSKLQDENQGKLFSQMLDRMEYYLRFPIDEQEGEPIEHEDMVLENYARMEELQRVAYSDFPGKLKPLALGCIKNIDSRKGMLKHLDKLTDTELRNLCVFVDILAEVEKPSETREMLNEIVLRHYMTPVSKKNEMNYLALYPTETLLWDRNFVPCAKYQQETCLALPKLNLQFLTIYDYLLRNFQLFRLESTYEIREDIAKTVWKLQPRLQMDAEENVRKTIFTGYSRMAVPLSEFMITSVSKPKLGEIKPSKVTAEVTVKLSPFNGETRRDWENLREHDVLFMLRIDASRDVEQDLMEENSLKLVDSSSGYRGPKGKSWDEMSREELGVTTCRGCEIMYVKDGAGGIIGERNLETQRIYEAKDDVRTFCVVLDCAQFQMDKAKEVETGIDIYNDLNLVLRRRSKENNFKAVLHTIRGLMNHKWVTPKWFKNLLLGYENPTANQYYNMADRVNKMKFSDTFVDAQHVLECFPGRKVIFSTEDVMKLIPPFKVIFSVDEGAPDYDTLMNAAFGAPIKVDQNRPPIRVEPYQPKFRNFHITHPKRNLVRFSPVQLEAIRSGMNHGLTMVVGPPGTGKTDVAVQIISNLYHNFPNQRTLLVTHSNQALNDLFEKIMERDIDERYLIRLGYGSRELETDRNMSKFGRVNYMLERRLIALQEVQRLSRTMGHSVELCQTCEMAEHFYTYHVLSAWEEFQEKAENWKFESKTMEEAKTIVRKIFPFSEFCEKMNICFEATSYEEDMELAMKCWTHITWLFNELKETRVFELLRHAKDRGNYLLSRHAKIIALTCTHAAMKREDFLQLHFQYDNIVMEEAAQILEVETLIPMMLQKVDREAGWRLKRIILIGDHHQLPPVVKNMSIQKYSKLDQSLFTRFVRLGTPTINLNMQGRARPSIARLYSWRYKQLGNLACTKEESRFLLGNAGLAYEFQAINVEDYLGQGCTQPNPYFYQNLGEAEYVVHFYMYLRLRGYPAEKISIITSYNGQKHLIRDVLARRCEEDKMYGLPRICCTVDKYQGAQNDIVLLSLVKTRTVGHIRDVRRLVVALSRSRLGVYVFCRVNLFQNCYELTPSFNVLLERPTKLALLPEEDWPTTRKLEDRYLDKQVIVEGVEHMAKIVARMADKVRYRSQIMYNQQVEEFARIAREELAARNEYDRQQRELDEKKMEAAAKKVLEAVEESSSDEADVPGARTGPGMELDDDVSDADDKDVEMKPPQNTKPGEESSLILGEANADTFQKVQSKSIVKSTQPSEIVYTNNPIDSGIVKDPEMKSREEDQNSVDLVSRVKSDQPAPAAADNPTGCTREKDIDTRPPAVAPSIDKVAKPQQKLKSKGIPNPAAFPGVGKSLLSSECESSSKSTLYSDLEDVIPSKVAEKGSGTARLPGVTDVPVKLSNVDVARPTKLSEPIFSSQQTQRVTKVSDKSAEEEKELKVIPESSAKK
jgi:intron-binding protein aquarius